MVEGGKKVIRVHAWPISSSRALLLVLSGFTPREELSSISREDLGREGANETAKGAVHIDMNDAQMR